MSFFKKLFGIKDKTPSSKTPIIKEQKSIIPNKLEPDPKKGIHTDKILKDFIATAEKDYLIKWFNHYYMQQRNNEELASAFKTIQPELKDIDENYVSLVVGLIKERATFVNDFWELSSFFFEAPKTYGEKAAKKAWKEDSDAIVACAIQGSC